MLLFFLLLHGAETIPKFTPGSVRGNGVDLLNKFQSAVKTFHRKLESWKVKISTTEIKLQDLKRKSKIKLKISTTGSQTFPTFTT